MTTILKTQRKTPGGEPVTRDYREFCARMGLDLLNGVFEPGHPHPFALCRPMICRKCGWIAETERLERDDAWILTLQPRGGDPQHAEPAEHAQVCVESGERDSFEPAPLCAECDAYPCVCQEGDAT